MPVKVRNPQNIKLLGNFLGMETASGFLDAKLKSIAMQNPKSGEQEYSPDDGIYRQGRPYAVSTSHGDGDYPYNDMLRHAADVVFYVHGIRILICPLCKSDLEPDSDDHDEIPLFCFCKQCNVKSFMWEMVADKSFRLPFHGEDVTRYFRFLELTYIDGQMKVLTGNLIKPA